MDTELSTDVLPSATADQGVAARPPRLSGAKRRAQLRAPLAAHSAPKSHKAPPPTFRKQVITGPYASADYVNLRTAQRKHTKLFFEGRGWGYVLAISHDDVQFRAIVQPVRAPKR